MIVSAPMTQTSSLATQTSQASEKTDAQKKADALGKTDFLTMLVAQIKAQDPMNPMENTDFTAQMAQFSSLEQLFNVNDKLGTMTDAVNSSNSVSALSLIGREVTAAGQSVEVKDGVASDISFTMPLPTDEATIVIEDGYGNVVRTIDQGTLVKGEHNIAWDGKDDNGIVLKDGNYTYSVLAEDQNGDIIRPQTYTRGTVTGVKFEDGVAQIFIGETKYSMSEITEVHQAKSITAAA